MSNIVVNTRCFQRKMTGIQRYTAEVLRYFPEKVPGICPPTILSKSVITNNLWEQFLLPLQLHGNLLWSPANIGPALCKNQVVTIHDTMPLEPNDHKFPSFGYFFSQWYRKALPKLVANVRHIITISKFSADRIMYHLGMPANKIAIIPCGIDHQKFYPRPEKEIQELINKKIIPGRKYVLALSSMLPYKNFKSILDAWKIVVNSLPEDVDLVLVGGMPKHEAYSLGNIPSRVHYLGYIEDKYLPALYSGAMFFVFVSLYEGFGLPPLEAMACGVPVLVSNTASIPEVVEGAGIEVNPLAIADIANNMKRLALTKELRKELVVKGIKNAERYSWQQTSLQVWQVLNNYL